MKELQKLLSTVRQAVQKYGMIVVGDKIAVGASGGKDSGALIIALSKLREFYPARFDLCAISVDMGFDTVTDIFEPVRRICDEYKVEYHVEKTQIKQIIFDERREENPCALCAKLRRGALNSAAISMGCNKVALGHHLDDAVDTFMMTLLFEGRIGSFSPVTEYADRGISVIRPMIYTKESDIKSLISRLELNFIESPCPENKNTERENIKTMLKNFDCEHRGVYKRILGAMERKEIDGWK